MLLREHHPYDVCEVISTEVTHVVCFSKLLNSKNFFFLKILQGNQPYLDWISESVPETSS